MHSGDALQLSQKAVQNVIWLKANTPYCNVFQSPLVNQQELMLVLAPESLWTKPTQICFDKLQQLQAACNLTQTKLSRIECGE